MDDRTLNTQPWRGGDVHKGRSGRRSGRIHPQLDLLPPCSNTSVRSAHSCMSTTTSVNQRVLPPAQTAPHPLPQMPVHQRSSGCVCIYRRRTLEAMQERGHRWRDEGGRRGPRHSPTEGKQCVYVDSALSTACTYTLCSSQAASANITASQSRHRSTSAKSNRMSPAPATVPCQASLRDRLRCNDPSHMTVILVPNWEDFGQRDLRDRQRGSPYQDGRVLCL